jgi:hypothetical protein
MIYTAVVLLAVLAVLAQVGATSYSLTINLDANSLSMMKADGYKLYLFKGIQGPSSALPTVWFSESNFMESTVITWDDEYNGYISATETKANALIQSMTSVSMKSGQTAVVDDKGFGTLTVQAQEAGDDNTVYYLLNNSDKQFTAGISQSSGGVNAPICAIPLMGHNVLNIVPISKVFVMFSTEVYNTGTVLYQAASGGLLLDMTNNPTVSVDFDSNKGWDFGGAGYGTLIGPKKNFQSFLNSKA